jgi:hypothetical protein
MTRTGSDTAPSNQNNEKSEDDEYDTEAQDEA